MSSGTTKRLPRSRSSSIRLPSAPPVTASHRGPVSRSRTAVRSRKSRTAGRLPGQDLVGQVVDDEPVAAGERLDEASDLAALRDAAQGQRGELKAGDPALGALLERVHVGGGEVQPHDPVEELPRLGRGEAEVGGAHLGELPATAQPGQRQRRIGAGRDHQVQVIGKVVEEEGHRLVHLGGFDDVVVVEDEDPLLPRLAFAGARDVVDERGQGAVARRWAASSTAVSTSRPALLEGSHEVGQEAAQVVVAVVEGEPRDAGVGLALIKVGRASRRAGWSCRTRPVRTRE